MGDALGRSFLFAILLRELGWWTLWLGRKTPASEVIAVLQRGGIQAVALSASANCSEPGPLAPVVRSVGKVCQQQAIPLLLGGAGAWPTSSPLAHRLTSLELLADRLARC